MLICIISIGPDLDSLVDSRFGRGAYFLIVDSEGKLIKSLENPGVKAIKGAGVAASQTLINEKVNIIIASNIGPNAFAVLNTSNIKIFSAKENLTAKQAFQEYSAGKLSEINEQK
jgi:predicted Fe-Mo cluster-binding NifX family protein